LKTQPPGAVAGGSERSGAVSGHLRLASAALGARECGGASYTCSTVARPSDYVVTALEGAMAQWIKSRDSAVLRRQLLALLMLVEKAE